MYGVLSSIERCATFYFYLFISVCVWSIEFYRRMCCFLFLFIYLFQSVYGVLSSIERCATFYFYLFIYLFQSVYGVLSSVERCATFYFY